MVRNIECHSTKSSALHQEIQECQSLMWNLFLSENLLNQAMLWINVFDIHMRKINKKHRVKVIKKKNRDYKCKKQQGWAWQTKWASKAMLWCGPSCDALRIPWPVSSRQQLSASVTGLVARVWMWLPDLPIFQDHPENHTLCKILKKNLSICTSHRLILKIRKRIFEVYNLSQLLCFCDSFLSPSKFSAPDLQADLFWVILRIEFNDLVISQPEVKTLNISLPIPFKTQEIQSLHCVNPKHFLFLCITIA